MTAPEHLMARRRKAARIKSERNRQVKKKRRLIPGSIAAQLAAGTLTASVPRSVTYQAYIASPAWRHRKAAYFKKYPKQCAGCGGKDEIHLHHRSYERFMHELDDDLVPLCSTCHMWVHHLERTTGLSLADATDAVLKSAIATSPA